jgi:aromatic ring-opening dioxygenase catalytic subunit (LigB family)
MKVTGCRNDNIKVIHLSMYKEWAKTFLTILMNYCENSGKCSDMKPLVQYKERLPSLYTGAEYKHHWLPCRYLIDSPIRIHSSTSQ